MCYFSFLNLDVHQRDHNCRKRKANFTFYTVVVHLLHILPHLRFLPILFDKIGIYVSVARH
jgi:hypothetical protein